VSFVVRGGSGCRFEVDIVGGLRVFGPHNPKAKKNKHTCSEGKLCGKAGKIAGLKTTPNLGGFRKGGGHLCTEISLQCLVNLLFVVLHRKPITITWGKTKLTYRGASTPISFNVSASLIRALLKRICTAEGCSSSALAISETS